MEILFKNKEKITVSDNIANILRAKILEGTPNDFQVFSDENNSLILIIRLSEIVYITK